MNLRDMIVPNKDFQTSINIEFDFGSKAKIESLIPTDSVCRYLEEIIRDIIVSSNQRAKLLVGAYGKGKSHVVLAALTAMWVKDASSFSRILEAYKERGLGFGETFEQFVSEGKRLLPVVVSGSTSDLRHSLLHALRNALRFAGLDDLMPSTNYDGAINVLKRWKDDYPDTLKRFEELTGNSSASIVSRLRSMDTAAYELFASAYPDLTSGGTFDALDGAEVIDVYERVLKGLERHDIDGIYVVYDEFSKYLETSLDRATFEDTKLLQDFAEACNRSGIDRQLHLLLISHKSLSNYIDSNLPKEKVDGWLGVSGRFREIEMADDANQYYRLLSSAIVKNDDLWKQWLAERGGENKRRLDDVGLRYVGQGLFDNDVISMITYGCFPLHPLTTYLLARMSEKIAQNERTLFTFICSDEENTLCDALKAKDAFVAPDYVYAYFEPLLRKEFYASPLHRTYELARASMSKVDNASLERRIIMTIAAIDIVAQYDRVAPTRQTIIDIYTDCGYESFEVNDALDNLVANDSVVYLKRSNAYLKLKETSGVHIDNEVSDRAAKLRNATTFTDLLNKIMRGKALYPSRYNEERAIVRYFDCGFASQASTNGWKRGERILTDTSGDGEVVAICAETPDELESMKEMAKDSLSAKLMTVIVFPRRYVDVADAAFRLEAARQLKAEAEADVVLAEEYEIVVEDYEEIIDDFVAGYFRPELGRSLYYIGASQEKGITRKRRLSEALSILCDEAYCDTPRITSEALNKNELTGAAFSSRTKILKALCASNLPRNFGFVGNGQETSMARSAFEKTGILDLVNAIELPVAKRKPGITKVLDAIRNFVEHAHETPFKVLYDELKGPDLKVGLREGPIPLYLAYVMREYRDEIRITRDGIERPFNEVILDDMSKHPDMYALTRLHWTPEMGEYLRDLARLFECNTSVASRNDVADAVRQWYVSLPQVTRNSRFDHTAGEKKVPIPKGRTAFFRTIRRMESDSNSFLFEELPKVFRASVGSSELVAAIAAEKEACDGYLTRTTDRLAAELIAMFDSDAHADATLGSVLRDWVDANPATLTHVFSGVNNQVLNVLRAANGDDRVTVNRLAKAATSLRIDDWNDARFDDFLRIMSGMKSEVEGIGDRDDTNAGERTISLVFVGEDGTTRQKTFEAVECGGRSRLLKNSILACLSEMGGALRPEEKRQIVFEVLEGLC
ncbi:MAG: hypothetical protein IKG21_00010 [Atopobiaceae bacterium]|nr:hypothetical protein [Atopobiaceae bacterium]